MDSPDSLKKMSEASGAPASEADMRGVQNARRALDHIEQSLGPLLELDRVDMIVLRFGDELRRVLATVGEQLLELLHALAHVGRQLVHRRLAPPLLGERIAAQCGAQGTSVGLDACILLLYARRRALDFVEARDRAARRHALERHEARSERVDATRAQKSCRAPR